MNCVKEYPKKQFGVGFRGVLNNENSNEVDFFFATLNSKFSKSVKSFYYDL